MINITQVASRVCSLSLNQALRLPNNESFRNLIISGGTLDFTTLSTGSAEAGGVDTTARAFSNSYTSPCTLSQSATKSLMPISTTRACSRFPRRMRPSPSREISSPTLLTLSISRVSEFMRYSSSYTLPFFPRAFFLSSRRLFLLVRRVVCVFKVPSDLPVYRVRNVPPEVDASVAAIDMSSGTSPSCPEVASPA